MFVLVAVDGEKIAAPLFNANSQYGTKGAKNTRTKLMSLIKFDVVGPVPTTTHLIESGFVEWIHGEILCIWK